MKKAIPITTRLAISLRMLNIAFCAATGRRITTQTVCNRLRDAQLNSDVHGEVHLCNLDTMQRGTDGPSNMLNGPLGIGITFSSPISVAYAYNQTIVGFVFGGHLVRLNVFETVSSECSKVALCGADVRHWWSWNAPKQLYST